MQASYPGRHAGSTFRSPASTGEEKKRKKEKKNPSFYTFPWLTAPLPSFPPAILSGEIPISDGEGEKEERRISVRRVSRGGGVGEMGDQLARGEELEKKAEKKLSGWAFFGNRHEDAADLFEKAANCYKLAKSCTIRFVLFFLIISLHIFGCFCPPMSIYISSIGTSMARGGLD